MNKEKIKRLRSCYLIPYSITDDQVLNNFSSTLKSKLIDLEIALEELKDSIIKALPQWVTKFWRLK